MVELALKSKFFLHVFSFLLEMGSLPMPNTLNSNATVFSFTYRHFSVFSTSSSSRARALVRACVRACVYVGGGGGALTCQVWKSREKEKEKENFFL